MDRMLVSEAGDLGSTPNGGTTFSSYSSSWWLAALPIQLRTAIPIKA